MYRDEGLLNYDLAYHSLEHLTVARAVQYLTHIFDCGTHEIYQILSDRRLREFCTPIHIATNPSLAGQLACNVGIWFWGGPPGDEEWYEGTLLTMLIDKLFYCVAMGYEDTVFKFLEVLNGSCNKARQTEPTAACGA
jgi:hypothetical protein